MSKFGRLTIAVAVTLALALGIAACGDESDPPSTTGSVAAERQQADQPTPKPSSPEQKKETAGGTATEGNEDESREGSSTATSHEDSGGGTAQFRVPGGDNSVQGFGSEAEDAELEEAAAALHGFLDARAAVDWATVCEHVASSVLKSLERLAAQSPEAKGKDCAELMAGLSAGVPASVRAEAAIADVGALRVEGEQGFLLYHGAQNTIFTMSMAREEGRWKVASLAGVPLS